MAGGCHLLIFVALDLRGKIKNGPAGRQFSKNGVFETRRIRGRPGFLPPRSVIFGWDYTNHESQISASRRPEAVVWGQKCDANHF